MPHARGSEAGIRISADTVTTGSVLCGHELCPWFPTATSHPPGGLPNSSAEHLSASLFSCVILLTVRFRLPVCPHFLSSSETLKGTSLCIGDSSALSVPALEQSVSSADSRWLLESPAF